MDPTLVFLVIALGAFIVFQVFQGRKRKRETEDRQSKFLPGIEIMTNYGLYGTIVSIDEDRNLVILETSPGVEIKVHRQTILKVADYDTPAAGEDDAVGDDEVTEIDAAADRDGAAPEFGERAEPAAPPSSDTSGSGSTKTDRGASKPRGADGASD
jgi:preprotein translocase subunit YajC